MEKDKELIVQLPPKNPKNIFNNLKCLGTLVNPGSWLRDASHASSGILTVKKLEPSNMHLTVKPT